MTILDEIQTEVWHIMMAAYCYQRKSERLAESRNRHEMIDDIVALNALAESVVVRISRLGDKRKDCRSVAMLIKRGNFGNCEAEVKRKAEDFQAAVEPVLKIRHEQIAHMKPGTISSYPLNPLPSEALTALERIIRLVDQARSKAVQYFAKVGSQEAAIDLRLSLQKGARN